MEYFSKDLIDFASNDYLGFSKNNVFLDTTNLDLVCAISIDNGEIELENHIANFHQVESASIFNSVYEATLCFFNSIPQKEGLIFYDELCHASICSAIQVSNAFSCQFQHNDFEDLERLIENSRLKTQYPKPIFIVTESVFSMDGDMPNLEELAQLSEKYNCLLVIDESQSVGVFGENGQGLVQNLQLQNKVFAGIISFGNALSCSGSAIIGSKNLKKKLDNFDSRSINKIKLSPKAIANIVAAYNHLESEKQTIEQLRENLVYFNQEINLLGLKPMFVRSKSAIHSAIINRNYNVKFLAEQFHKKGFIVKTILSPDVPEGQERLQFCLHSFNTKEEISILLDLLCKLVFG
jgi:8-amino-7-oxononanoate synthase